MEPGNLIPACLPPGTRVGPWRVVGLCGRGTYGAVYHAVRQDSGDVEPVALKLALYPGDARFTREGELLSRIRHPGVPRLRDQGQWQHPAGALHPYLVMELVEGVPLYDWARAHLPSSRQVLQVIAGLARALEATHAAGGVHRDVKGDNVLVRNADGQCFLMDFGSGHYRGAATLTWPVFPPGTPAYRTPEAWRFVLRQGPASLVPYAPGPADDVFALGVTAYRLVTQAYPPSTDPSDEESRPWYQEGTGARPARDLNVRCCPELSELIARMLSVSPEARGSAREVAEALEQAARCAEPGAELPLFAGNAARPVGARPFPRRVAPQAPRRSWRPWLVATSVGAPLALGVAWLLSARLGMESMQGRIAMQRDTRDGGTVALGDSMLTAPEDSARVPPSVWSAISLEIPPKPLPGQIRPDAQGRCPSRVQVPINAGCWIKADVDPKDCDEGNYVYKGRCYTPVFPPPRPATSGPANRPESQ